MQRFAQLYTELDASTATRDKIASLTRVLGRKPRRTTAAWAAYFLGGWTPAAGHHDHGLAGVGG